MQMIATADVVEELRSISKGLSKIKYMLEKAQDYDQAAKTTRSVEWDVDALIDKIQIVRQSTG